MTSRYATNRKHDHKWFAPLADVYCDGDDAPTWERGRYLPLGVWRELALEDTLPPGLVLENSQGRRVKVLGRSVK